MSTEIVPIQRTNMSSFDAFNIAPGQDANIRWLSRPNQQLVQQKYSNGAEKFRITFDAENFQPEQIKVSRSSIKIERFFLKYFKFRFTFKITN